MASIDGNRPLVSVILPAYNAESYIEDAVRSVMNQSIDSWELLIIDDCSGDATYSIAQRLANEDKRILLHKNEKNAGVSAARNRGIALSSGTYIAFLDSDDLWHERKLERQLQRLRQTGADLAYASYAIIGPDEKKAKADYIVPDSISYEELLKENVIGCSTVLLKADIAKKYGFGSGFYHEDYVLWVTLLKEGCRAVGCTEVLASWRYIENSRSFDKRKAARNRWIIYRKYLGLPFWKAAYLFACYATAGLKKYMSNR